MVSFAAASLVLLQCLACVRALTTAGRLGARYADIPAGRPSPTAPWGKGAAGASLWSATADHEYIGRQLLLNGVRVRLAHANAGCCNTPRQRQCLPPRLLHTHSNRRRQCLTQSWPHCGTPIKGADACYSVGRTVYVQWSSPATSVSTCHGVSTVHLQLDYLALKPRFPTALPRWGSCRSSCTTRWWRWTCLRPCRTWTRQT